MERRNKEGGDNNSGERNERKQFGREKWEKTRMVKKNGVSDF